MCCDDDDFVGTNFIQISFTTLLCHHHGQLHYFFFIACVCCVKGEDMSKINTKKIASRCTVVRSLWCECDRREWYFVCRSCVLLRRTHIHTHTHETSVLPFFCTAVAALLLALAGSTATAGCGGSDDDDNDGDFSQIFSNIAQASIDLVQLMASFPSHTSTHFFALYSPNE